MNKLMNYIIEKLRPFFGMDKIDVPVSMNIKVK